MSRKGWFYAQLEAIQYEMRQRDDMLYFYELTAPRASTVDLPPIDLEADFGRLRVNNTGINELWYGSVIIGAGMIGTPAIAHIPYQGGTVPFDVISQNAAKIRYKTGGVASLPIVFFFQESGQGAGSGPQHSDYELASFYAKIPGVKTIVPSTVYDAKGLMHAAIKDPDPVVYINPSRLQAQVDDAPDEAYEVLIGEAVVRTEGQDLTIVGSGPVMPHVQAVAEQLADEGVSAETIDLRTLHPLDRDTIIASARKTGRVLAADAGKYSYGVGAEVVASVAEALPGTTLRRVAYPDAPPPGAPEMFDWMQVTPERIYDAAQALLHA